MAQIVAVTACPTGIAHTQMAAEALKKTAQQMGHQIRIETQGSEGTRNILSPQEIAAADVVLLAADIRVDPIRFADKPIYETRTSEAIRNTRQVIEAAVAQSAASNGHATAAPVARLAAEAEQAAPALTDAPTTATAGKRLVGITSCPTGIAHTFMAAEALLKAARNMGHQIKVETQGSVGAQNQLTAEEIAAADAVVIAADVQIDTSRFAGKRLYMTSTKQAMHHGQDVIRTALEQPLAPAGAAGASLAETVERAKAERSATRSGPYKHLMTGVSYMLPFVVAGGLMIALAFAVGGIYVMNEENRGTLGWGLFQIGGPSAFALMVPILAGFIAFSIADRPGLAPGMIGGMLASSIGAGFFGGIIAGFIAGYSTAWLNRVLKLPPTLAGLKPVLILPLLGAAITGLLMVFVVGGPASAALGALTAWLRGMQSSGAVVLGVILGAMMAFDMGGPVNKSAYAFAAGLLGSEVYGPMAAVMAAGMTPPLGLALATVLFKNRFTTEEREAGKAASVLGVSFITEGAIPFAAEDPFRVIPALAAGSAVTGALSMLFDCELRVPHGGIFVLPIPNAVTNLGMYILAILAGTLVTAAMLFVLKRPLAAEPVAAAQSERQAAI
ncbi:MAG TPA: PTS fructose-like transporter subunit IIB [Roseiflexaceae bacterium]|nr:PTS fructose-like transporter subunit IIB [Roseiflexaceae bacterium]